MTEGQGDGKEKVGERCVCVGINNNFFCSQGGDRPIRPSGYHGTSQRANREVRTTFHRF